MVRILVCSALLFGFIFAVKAGLNGALDAWGFWPYMVICIVGTGLVIAAAFAYDRAEARSRRSPPPGPNDRPTSAR